ncbi:MAG: hypothetical protein ACRCXD_17355, partial [Luteolibacter sp.]
RESTWWLFDDTSPQKAIMIRRRPLFCCLTLVLVSCDKPKETATIPEKSPAPRRATKSARPLSSEPVSTPEEIRETFENAQAIQSPEHRNKALEEVVWDALELDPHLAAEAFLKLTPRSEEKNRLIQHYAMRLAEQSLDEAMQWAATFHSEEERSLAYDNIALVLAESEPERAAQMLSESGIAGRDFDVAVVQVLQRWAASSPEGAAGWVVLFEEGEARSAGLKAVVGIWSRTDPEGALVWLDSLQNPAIRQEASDGLAQSILDLPEGSQDDLLRRVSPDIRSRFESLKTEAAEQ